MYIDMGHLIDLDFRKVSAFPQGNWMEGSSEIVYPFSWTMNSVDGKICGRKLHNACTPSQEARPAQCQTLHPSSSTSSASSVSLLRVHSYRAEVLMMKICEYRHWLITPSLGQLP